MCWTSQVYHPYSRLGAHFGGGGDIGLGPVGPTDERPRRTLRRYCVRAAAHRTMPPKRYDHIGVCYLTTEETAALLAAPDRSTWTGRCDRALLQVAVQTGLRVSELIALRRQDAHLGAGPHVRCYGRAASTAPHR